MQGHGEAPRWRRGGWAVWRGTRLAYFREIFPLSAGWRRVRGYVVATVLDAELPISLLASFVARHGGLPGKVPGTWRPRLTTLHVGLL